MSELPKHFEHLLRLTEGEEAADMTRNKRHEHCDGLREDEIIGQIHTLIQERSNYAGRPRCATQYELLHLKNMYTTFKQRSMCVPHAIKPETRGRTIDPPLFKPEYHPPPPPTARSKLNEDHLDHSLRDVAIFQQDLGVSIDVNPSNVVDVGSVDPTPPSGKPSGKPSGEVDVNTSISDTAEGSAHPDSPIDEGRHPDAFGLTDPKVRFNRMKRSLNAWTAKQHMGSDIVPISSDNEDADVYYSDEDNENAYPQDLAQPTPQENPGTSAKGKEKQATSHESSVKPTAIQRRAAQKKGRKGRRTASPTKAPTGPKPDTQTSDASSGSEGDSSGRTTTWVVNVMPNEADTEQQKRDNIRALLGLLLEPNARETNARQVGTVLGEIIEEAEDPQKPEPESSKVPPPVKSMSKKARNKARKEARNNGGQ